MSSPTEVTFSIVRVKDTSFFVDEKLFNPEIAGTQMQVRINCELSFNLDSNYVIIDLDALCFYQYLDDTEGQFAKCKVQTIFQIKDLKDFLKGDDLLLPQNAIVALTGISISHTRALFAKNLGGSAYTNVIIPIIEPLGFAKTVFPHMFMAEEEGDIKPG